MIELVKKDFLIGRYYFVGLFFLITFVTSMGLVTMIEYLGGIMPGVLVLLTLILCLISSLLFINIDSSCRADELFLSLPIKRQVIVYSRYLTSFIMVFFCLLLIYITCLVFVYIFRVEDQHFDLILNYRGIVAIFFFISMILFTVFPLLFKYGAGKGGGIGFYCIAFILILPALSKLIMKALKGVFSFDFSFFSEWAKNMISWLNNLHLLVLYLLLI